jgi:hypothetical protein
MTGYRLILFNPNGDNNCGFPYSGFEIAVEDYTNVDRLTSAGDFTNLIYLVFKNILIGECREAYRPERTISN